MGPVGGRGHTEEESDFTHVHFKPTSATTPAPQLPQSRHCGMSKVGPYDHLIWACSFQPFFPEEVARAQAGENVSVTKAPVLQS